MSTATSSTISPSCGARIAPRPAKVTGAGEWTPCSAGTLTPTIVLADDADEARAIAARIRDEVRARAALGAMVQSVRTIDDVIPPDQPAKMVEIDAIRALLTPRILASLPEASRALADRFLGPTSTFAPSAPSTWLAPRLHHRPLRERDGTLDRAVLVFPRKTPALWLGSGLATFTHALREAAAVPGRAPALVAGSLPLSADIVTSIERDAPRASGAAFACVVAGVLLLLRRAPASAYVLGALLAGVVWLLGGAMALGVKVNFANFVVLPITFGIGVDYAVNVVSRFTGDGEQDVARAVRSTGSAVALCSLTTILGYSSLVVAQNRALRSFGVLAVMGEVCCLTVALTVLPAFLELARRRKVRALAQVEAEAE